MLRYINGFIIQYNKFLQVEQAMNNLDKMKDFWIIMKESNS